MSLTYDFLFELAMGKVLTYFVVRVAAFHPKPLPQSIQYGIVDCANELFTAAQLCPGLLTSRPRVAQRK